jgi:DNA-binding beta-propeller fold protein YncE
VYVADSGNNHIQVFDAKDNLVQTIPTASPVRLAIGSQGKLFVISQHTPELQVLKPDGKLLKTIDGGAPIAVALAQNGSIYLVNGKRLCISVLDQT